MSLPNNRLLNMQMVEEEYEDLFPGQVLAVETVHDTTHLESLTATYSSTSLQLWDLISEYSNKKREGKKIKRSQVREPANFAISAFHNRFLLPPF